MSSIPGPTQPAIEDALAVLQQSINNQGGPQLLADPFASSSRVDLDFHISAIEAAGKAFQAGLAVHVALLKQHRNSLSPIHRLPNELLTKVLLKCMDRQNWTLYILKQYASVSKRWLDVVKNTPDFWTFIDIASPAPLVNLFLRKSRSALLNIKCVADDRMPSRVEDFVDAVHGHSDRWQSLTFRGTATPRLLTIFGSAHPRLTSLDIGLLWHWRQTRPFFLPKNAPLEHLRLHSASLDWAASSLSGLTTLALRDLAVNPPTYRQVAAMIEASPRLEVLILQDIALMPIAGQSDGESTVMPTTAIELPLLHNLTLRNIPNDTLIGLLTRVRTPVLRRLIVEDIPPALFAADSFVTLAQPVLHAANSISLTAEGRLKDISLYTLPQVMQSDAGEDRPGLHLRFTSETPMPQLLSISMFLNNVGLRPETQTLLKVGKTEWWPAGNLVELTPEIPLALPNLTCLHIGNGVSVAAVLEQIGQPDRDDAGRITGWPLPQLSDVSISLWEGDHRPITNFLTGRWGAEAEEISASDVPSRAPQKLKSLVLPPSSPRDLRDLVRTGFWREGGAADVILANPYRAGVTI